MKLFIEPLDVMFFRDGKPFVAGQTHLAQSLFPPTSLTFQGAIRSAILATAGISVDLFRLVQQGAHDPEATRLLEEIGGSTSFGHLCLRGPFVASCRIDLEWDKRPDRGRRMVSLSSRHTHAPRG